MTQQCEVRLLHRVTYENGMAMQEKLVSLRQQNRVPDQLLLLEHPPVITLGRGGDPANLLASQEALRAAGVRYYETTRGGDMTYHGPGQMVGYPILHMGEGSRDVRKYVTKLEEVLIRTVGDFGISARRSDGQRGVWVGNRKIAAIGVRIARWVTSHGFALNVRPELEHFRLITPCGIRGAEVTSMEQLLGTVRPDEVARVLLGHFAERFDRELDIARARYPVVTILPYDGDRVLLLHRRPDRGDFWQPVTGGVDPGEAPSAAAQRELQEETGFTAPVRPLSLRQTFLIDPEYLKAAEDDLIFADEESFAALEDSHQPVRLDPEEHDRAAWFSFDEAVEKVIWSDDRETIEALRQVCHAERSEASGRRRGA
jgi:lipoyl(octanoyl) transferase